MSSSEADLLENGASFAGKDLKFNTEKDVQDVVQQIQDCKEYLELKGNTLCVNAAEAIVKSLENRPELETDVGKDFIAEKLKIIKPLDLSSTLNLLGPHLQYINLSDINISKQSILPGLIQFFQRESSFSLKVLICVNNGLGPEGAEELAKALTTCRDLSIQKGGEVFNLRKFVCSRNSVQNYGASKIANFLQACDSLEEIGMSQNSIDRKAQPALAKGFANNTKLRILNFNDNSITGNGLELNALADTLSSLKCLQELDLGDCLLGSQGSVRIVTALKDLSQLETLVLEGNEIELEGGKQISKLLKNSKSLRSLNLSTNSFGENGNTIIKDILSTSGLTSLVMDEEEELDFGEYGSDDSEEESNDDTEDEESQDGINTLSSFPDLSFSSI